MNIRDLKNYGCSISDNEGELRDVSGVVAELKELRDNFDTDSMSDYSLTLQGQKEMLSAIIEYLERI